MSSTLPIHGPAVVVVLGYGNTTGNSLTSSVILTNILLLVSSGGGLARNDSLATLRSYVVILLDMIDYFFLTIILGKLTKSGIPGWFLNKIGYLFFRDEACLRTYAKTPPKRVLAPEPTTPCVHAAPQTVFSVFDPSKQRQ